MVAQFSGKEAENEAGVYETKVSVASDLDTLRFEGKKFEIKMVSKSDIFEAFDDLGFCVEDPLIIDRLYKLCMKYGVNETQLAWKYLAFAKTAVPSYELNFGNLCLYELLHDHKENSKSPVAQFIENESEVQDTTVSVASESEDLDTMIDEMINTETPVEAIRPSGRKSMVAQFLEKGTGNESEVQDITVSVPSEKVIPNPFMGKKFLGNDVPNQNHPLKEIVEEESLPPYQTFDWYEYENEELITMDNEEEEKENNSDQIVEKGSENESKVQDTTVSVASKSEEQVIDEETVGMNSSSLRYVING